MPSLRLTYDAYLENIDTGDTIDDPRVLAACDGVKGYGLASDANAFSGGIQPESMVPVLMWSAQTGLAVEIRMDVRGAPPPQFVEEAAALVQAQRGRASLEFDLPEGVEDAVVRMGELRDRVPTTQASEIASLATEWRGVTFERLAALSDDALAALGARLGAIEPRLRRHGGPEGDALRMLAAAVRSHQQRRTAERRYGR